VVRRAWRLRLEGLTLDAILERCPGLYTTANGLAQMFANPIYKGTLYFGGTAIPMEPIVTAEEWARVNAQREARRSGAYARRKTSIYLLSGFVRCARCGYSLSGRSDGVRFLKDGSPMRRYRSYACIGRMRNHICDLPAQQCEQLEAAVFDALLNDVLTEEQLRPHLEATRRGLEAGTNDTAAQVQAARARLAELDHAINGLLDLAEQGLRDGRVAERLRQREEEREEAARALRRLEAQQGADQPDLSGLWALREELRGALSTAPPERVRALLGEIIEEILVDDQVATLRVKLPFAHAGL
jgi:site-specific DNA recombinase